MVNEPTDGGPLLAGAMLEIELKFPVPDLVAVEAAFVALGARRQGESTQSDTYFQHPARDFAATDEAFRIRSVGDENSLTYKSGRLDPQVKIRREIEVGTEPGPHRRQALFDMLQALGFSPVRTVQKRRVTYTLDHTGRHFELTLDRVDGLGDFVEIETLAENADQQAEARAAVLALADRLQLHGSVQQSYLAMLLAQDETQQT